MRSCSDGCGRMVASYAQECVPVAPWDTPGLPARSVADRCSQHHGLCAYRDDDPVRCRMCHKGNGSNEICESCAPRAKTQAKRRATLEAKALMEASLGGDTHGNV